METQNNTPDYTGKRRGRSNRPFGGIVLVVIGSLLLARQLDVDIPRWIFSWEMILIAVGVYIGARRSFVPGGWIVPIILGCAFLVQEEFLGMDSRHYFWPVFIIGMGLYMILRPRKGHWEKGFNMGGTSDGTSDDFADSYVVFGGVKKKIISKNFQGGRIENLFGGTDIDLMQADFKGTITLDVNVAFGGVKLVVPPQWNIKNEIGAILGGVDDKRPSVQNEDATKVLVLRGTVMFGGVDIKSY